MKKFILLCLICSFVLLLVFSVSSLAYGATTTVPAGRGPYAVLANSTAHEVYIANMWSDEITVINSLTDTTITTIKVGPPYRGGLSAPVALAYNPNTNKLYVVNFWSAKLMAIDLVTHQVEATISVGYSHTSPRTVVVNPNTNLVYVANVGQNLIHVIDGQPANPTYNQVIATIPVGYYPRSEAINTNLNRLYTTNAGSNTVSVIDIDPASPNYHQVIVTIPVGAEPYALALNHATAKVYVTNRQSNTVSVIDGTTNSVIATVNTGANPRSLDINPDRNLIYVVNRDSNSVTVIDGNTDSVTSTVSTGTRPYAVACIKTPTGNTYVTNQGTGSPSTVTIIDSGFSTSETAVGVYPASLSIDTLLAKPKVYVGNYGSNDVSVIDPEGGSPSLLAEIDNFPGNTTFSTMPVFSGRARSLFRPYPTKITKVLYLIDSLDSKWKEARITRGKGTPDAVWEADSLEPLSLGTHTIYAVVLDMGGATVSSSDGNMSSGSSAGQIVSYTFEVVPETSQMYIRDIRFSKQIVNKNDVLQFEVAVRDRRDNPVDKAVITGALYTEKEDLLPMSGLTNADGSAVFTYLPQNGRLKKGVYLFLVQSVQKDGYDYDPSLNLETYDYWIEKPGEIPPGWLLNALRKLSFPLPL